MLTFWSTMVSLFGVASKTEISEEYLKFFDIPKYVGEYNYSESGICYLQKGYLETLLSEELKNENDFFVLLLFIWKRVFACYRSEYL